MHLDRMRQRGLSPGLTAAAATSYARTHGILARASNSDLLNAFARTYPAQVGTLPCACNYQWLAPRRELWCHSAELVSIAQDPPVAEAHFVRHDAFAILGAILQQAPSAPAASSHIADKFVRDMPSGASRLALSMHAASSTISTEPPGLLPNVNSVSQRHAVSGGGVRWGDTVYVLTRTAGRPFFFEQTRHSVSAQTYPHVRHIVLTDDAVSKRTYLATVSLGPSPPDEVIFKARQGSEPFNPDEICDKCGQLARSPVECASAPPYASPDRQPFFACYCETRYPMNLQMNYLLDRVRSAATTEPGWMLVLDDDNILTSPHAIARLIAHGPDHADQLVLFRAMLGRETPSRAMYGQRFVMPGDIDAANFMVHSSHLGQATWDGRRCSE